MYNEFILILEKISEKVSVIVTGYNDKKGGFPMTNYKRPYFRLFCAVCDTIDALEQTAAELILIDDGSQSIHLKFVKSTDKNMIRLGFFIRKMAALNLVEMMG